MEKFQEADPRSVLRMYSTVLFQREVSKILLVGKSRRSKKAEDRLIGTLKSKRYHANLENIITSMII